MLFWMKIPHRQYGEKIMRIAACDDNLEFLQGLSKLLNNYSEENHCNLEYKTFTNPLELVAQMEKGVHYDAILLDVCMPGINGIQCAKDIRRYDNFVKIIFLTSSTEFAVESYSVRAYQYLLKPIKKENLFSLLRLLESESETVERNILVYRNKAGISIVALSKLEYCEVNNRKITLHLTNGEECECNLKMNELEEKLEKFGMFLKPHRSFLINMDYIQTLSTHSILMKSGTRIPVPREKYTWIKQVYMEYICQSSVSVVLGSIES